MQPIVVIYLLWVVWFLTWLAAAMGTRDPHRKLSSLQNFIYRITTLAATFLLFTITPWPGLDVQYRFWERTLDESLSWLLVGVAFVGFCLAWWSTVHRIAAQRRGREVVDNGPYGVVRHPIYIGLILAAFATAVMFGRPSSMAGAVLFTIAFVGKILIEEQALREEAGAYDDYIGRVPMFLPFFPTRDKPRGQASAPPEPTLLAMAAVDTKAEEPASETLLEPVDDGDEELFSETVRAPVTEPESQPEKPAVTNQNTGPGAPAGAKAVQLTLLLDDAPVISEATAKD